MKRQWPYKLLNTVCQKQKLLWLWWMMGNMTGLLIWSSCHGNTDKGFSRESSRLGADGRITSSYDEELKGSCKRVCEVLSAISAWCQRLHILSDQYLSVAWWRFTQTVFRNTVDGAFCWKRSNHCFVSRNIKPKVNCHITVWSSNSKKIGWFIAPSNPLMMSKPS